MTIKNNTVYALAARPKATRKPFLVAVKARDGPYMDYSKPKTSEEYVLVTKNHTHNNQRPEMDKRLIFKNYDKR